MGDLAAQSIWLVPISAIVGVFTFITVLAWVGEKRKERESFYRSEVLKKIADNPGDAARNVLELMRAQERSTEIRVREGIKLGGLITAAVGIGLMSFLKFLLPGAPVWMVGLIPLLVGAALLAYAFILAPKVN
jgi:hypothetical protein